LYEIKTDPEKNYPKRLGLLESTFANLFKKKEMYSTRKGLKELLEEIDDQIQKVEEFLKEITALELECRNKGLKNVIGTVKYYFGTFKPYVNKFISLKHEVKFMLSAIPKAKVVEAEWAVEDIKVDWSAD